MKKYRPKRTLTGRKFYYPKDGGNHDGKYNSAEYRRQREAYLEAHPRCEIKTHCNGAKATCVYHIQPIRYKGDPRLTDPNNQKASCYSCNNAEAWSRRKGNT